MKAVIFTGTSISHEDAKSIVDAVYKNPVVRGDVETAASLDYDIIAIIDGMFFDRAAVSHKEILYAIKKGIQVIGGGSMGALRASELDVHGMIGIGKVYEWYRDGIIESDDEVAVITHPETFETLSTPLVNIRETFHSACENGIIDKDIYSSLLDIAMKLYYPHRSYPGIINIAAEKKIVSDKEILLDYCLNNENDVKRQDACLVLEKVKELLNE